MAITTTYLPCNVFGCADEWAFDLEEIESADYSVGIMGDGYVFMLNVANSCEHAAALSDADREAYEIKVGYDYAAAGGYQDGWEYHDDYD